MKVTKLIKDYVTEQVNEVYSERIAQVDEDYLMNYALPVQEIIDKCIASFNKQLEEELANKGFVLTNYYGNTEQEFVQFRGNYKINGKSFDDNSKKKTKLITEKNNKIKEILVTLELGGTKEQLDEMLRNL